MIGTSGMHPTPQMFSRDYYVRFPHRRLADIVFEHLCTEQDPAVLRVDPQLCRAGITEWIGRCGPLSVSLGWDWGQSQNGSIRLLKAVAPRTNLMALDAKGYDMAGAAGTHALWSLIESLPWRATVALAVRAHALQLNRSVVN